MLFLDLEPMDYREALGLQHSLVAAKANGGFGEDILLLLEHSPVFTLGRRGGKEFLRVGESLLASRGIALVQVERGGYITYHGPGQLVGYPIVDLGRRGLEVVRFVEVLEEAMIRTAGEFGVGAERSPRNRGVWAGDAKLGSVGIAVRRGISFHGFALNVNNSLEPFQWMEPCGLQGVGMTSLKGVLGREVPMAEVRGAAGVHLEELLGVSLERVRLEEIRRGLQGMEARVGGT